MDDQQVLKDIAADVSEGDTLVINGEEYEVNTAEAWSGRLWVNDGTTSYLVATSCDGTMGMAPVVNLPSAGTPITELRTPGGSDRTATAP